MIFFCLDIPNAKKMKHERIIGSKQRDPVIDSDRCIQHVIIQVGVSAVCHRRYIELLVIFASGARFPFASGSVRLSK